MSFFFLLSFSLRFPPVSFTNYSPLALSFSLLLIPFFFLFHFSSTLHLPSCRIVLPLSVCVFNAMNGTSENFIFVICYYVKQAMKYEICGYVTLRYDFCPANFTILLPNSILLSTDSSPTSWPPLQDNICMGNFFFSEATCTVHLLVCIYEYIQSSDLLIGWQCGLWIAITLFFHSSLFTIRPLRSRTALLSTRDRHRRTYCHKADILFPFEHATGIPKTECAMQNK